MSKTLLISLILLAIYISSTNWPSIHHSSDQTPQSHSPKIEAYFDQVVFTDYKDGIKQADINSLQAKKYSDNPQISLTSTTLNLHQSQHQNQQWHIQSNTAFYHPEHNNIQFIEDVKLINPNRHLSISTQALMVDTHKKTAQSKHLVEIQSEFSNTKGHGMVAQLDQQFIQLQSSVETIYYAPKKTDTTDNIKR